jgi:hypothetical protein
MLGMAEIRGRDATLPKGGPRAPVAYDSIVVNSNGIGAITFAARLARSPEFQGKVVVAAKPVAESRRLIDGCTLRARSVDYYAAACGVTREAVLGEVYGSDWRQAVADRQYAAYCNPDAAGRISIDRRTVFMDGENVRRDRTPRQPLSYGVRNSRLMGALNDLALECGVSFVEEPASSYDDLRALAPGQNPLIVNGTPKPIDGAAWREQPPPPRDFVAAAQMAFTSPKLARAGIISPHDSFVGLLKRDGTVDMCVFYPFQDPLSPAATFYGIFFRIVRNGAQADKAREQDILRGELEQVAEALGLSPDAPEETMGTAFVPLSPWRKLGSRQVGVLDLSRISGAGCPIIAGDGMARAGLGGFAAAEAILLGEAPERAMNEALGRWRLNNRMQAFAMTKLPSLTSFLVRTMPGVAFAGIGKARDFDMWAGAY